VKHIFAENHEVSWSVITFKNLIKNKYLQMKTYSMLPLARLIGYKSLIKNSKNFGKFKKTKFKYVIFQKFYS